MIKIDLLGQSFNRLIVVEEGGRKNGSVMWRCRCSCGGEAIANGLKLKMGHTQSCGCLQKERAGQANTTHGMFGTPTYEAWASMLTRVRHSPKNYEHVELIDPRWERFEEFLADMGVRPEGYTLDRHPDNEGGYGLSNCRWATPQQQSENRRNVIWVEHEGDKVTLTEYARRAGKSKSTVHRHYHAGKLLFP